MNTLRLLMICTVSYGFLLCGGDKPARGERRSDSVIRTRLASEQRMNAQSSQISVIEQKMQQRIDVVFFDQPLKDVVTSLGTKLNVPFYIDERALTEVGMDSNTPVNIDLRNIKAEVAMRLLMKSLQLTWLVRNDMVLVTTPEAAEQELEVRIYQCQDFLDIASSSQDQGGMNVGGGMGGFQNVPPGRIRGEGFRNGQSGGSDGRLPAPRLPYPQVYNASSDGDSRHRDKTLQDLIKLIPHVIEPLSWEDRGGSGTIGSLSGGILVISATSRVHTEVGQLLQKLRMAKKVGPNAAITYSSEISVIEQKMQQRIDVVFFDQPLKDVLDALGDNLNVAFYIDERALTEVGLDTNTPVNINFRNIKADVALRLIMNSLSLTWLIRDDLVLVTTPEAAEQELVLRVYPCPDFLESIDQSSRRGRRKKGLGNLIAVIQNKISADSWADVGGTGVIVEYGAVLVVTQLPSIHREVESMLRGLRTAKKSKSGATIHFRESPMLHVDNNTNPTPPVAPPTANPFIRFLEPATANNPNPFGGGQQPAANPFK